jgi:hypothetical protein
VNNLTVNFEDRSTQFGQFCRDFDEEMLYTYFPVYRQLRFEGRSVTYISEYLHFLTGGQLATMATAYNHKYEDGQQSEYETPMQMDQVRSQVPVDMRVKSGPFGAATILCEQCRDRFTLKKGQWDQYERAEIPVLICIDCQQK